MKFNLVSYPIFSKCLQQEARKRKQGGQEKQTYCKTERTWIGNFRISQEINSLLNGMNSQIENAISSAISERIIPQMQGVVETILNRQLENGQPLSRRPPTANDDDRNVDENNLQNRTSRSRQNFIELEDESPYIFD